MLLLTINPNDPLGPLQLWYKDADCMILLGSMVGTDSPLSIHHKERVAA